MLKKLFTAIGEYFLLLGKVLSKPQKRNVYLKLLVREFYDLGVNSFGLVLFTSFFVGAVVAIQMYNNFSASSFPIPNSFIGYATKVVLKGSWFSTGFFQLCSWGGRSSMDGSGGATSSAPVTRWTLGDTVTLRGHDEPTRLAVPV